MEEKIVAPAVEDKTAAVKTETIGEILAPKEAKPEPRVVPEAKFLEIKKELKELKKQIEDGATKKEVAADLQELAIKYDVNKDFLQDLANIVKTKTEAEFETRLDSTLQPYKEKEKEEKINSTFEKHFSQAIETMPELKDVVNKEVIKSLSLQPQNAAKTFAQIIEEVYGSTIKGKRSIDHSNQGNNRATNIIDIDKARKDTTFFKETMKDEVGKREYNKDMVKRLSSVL
jgi:hypothetical protein